MTTPFPFVANTVLNASQLNAITTLPISAKTASATLVVGDVGYRVQMTSASATTITVNTSIFAAGDTIWIQNMGTGVCTITAGTATVGTASSLALAQYGGGTLVFQSASAATFFSQVSATYGTATGLTGALASPPAGYSGLYATADGTLTVTKAGLFDVLMFAGAGGGCNGASGYPAGGGGGGAGGKVLATVYLAATTYAVTVGAGGAGGLSNNEHGFQGLATGITNVLAAVGGGGGLGNEGTRLQGSIGRGGCGGGAGNGSSVAGGAVLSQGFAGAYFTGSGSIAGAGGGGVAALGLTNSGATAGAGGTGFDVSSFIGGSTLTKGTGGNGGSGAGAGAAGAANSANGGVGGGLADVDGGIGGSGIFYIRFKV
jgi:hypothetical protein